MKRWLPTIAFFGFIFLWMTGRIESGLALTVFGICWAGIVFRMAFLGVLKDDNRHRRGR